ncbi:MAG: epimerase [Chloroflexi bacterium RBG_16_72_14]|nr:MAG: epimerase [Chloroflexi bacterium RBG_16_72_14]
MPHQAVTGALGFSGRHIATRLLARGDEVVNLTNHPDRPDPFDGRIPAKRLAFDDVAALAASLRGVNTLFNTYWVRFRRLGLTHADAVRNSRTLFEAALEAGVRRIVHVSIANPDPASPLAYYRGKAQVEAALATVGVSHAVLRPAVLFGDEPILANSIAWLLRRSPVFAIPGDGRYAIQPIDAADLADLALQAADRDDDLVWDAVGPEVFSFTELVEAIRKATGSRARLVHVPPRLALLAAWGLGRVVRDTLLTTEELEGLMTNLLVSRDLPRGTARFTDWLAASGAWLGRDYLPEVSRHFVAQPA